MTWVGDDQNVWFCPAYIHQCCVELAQNPGIEQLKKDRNYKKLIESYDLSLAALAIYGLNKKTHGLPFIQILKNDPPDGLIGQASKVKFGDFDISKIELTRYDGVNNQSLRDQLISSNKINAKYNKYGGDEVILVKIKEGLNPNYLEVNKCLIDFKTISPVWCLKVIETHPDTIVQLVVLNPKIQEITINVGEVANEYKQQKIQNVVEVKRAASIQKVRTEINNTIDKKYFDKKFGWLL